MNSRCWLPVTGCWLTANTTGYTLLCISHFTLRIFFDGRCPSLEHFAPSGLARCEWEFDLNLWFSVFFGKIKDLRKMQLSLRTL
jgi:hypothetical protein